MKNTLKLLTATLLIYVAFSMLQSDVRAAEGTGGGSSCMVTVITTNEDGSVDPSVNTSQAPCRAGESNGGYEYYNPYTDTYKYKSADQALAIEPLKSTKKRSSGSRAGTSTSNSSSGDDSTTSPNKPKTGKTTKTTTGTSTPR